MNRIHFMILRISLAVMLLITSLSLQAQPKPKRDKSKDRVVVPQNRPKRVTVTQAKKHVKPSSSSRITKKRTVVSSRKTQNSKKRNVGIRRLRMRREATFLTVDNSDSPIRTVPHDFGYIELNVNTDGSQWNVHNECFWLRVFRDLQKSTIRIFFDNNTSNYMRAGWFDVYSDNDTVRVHIIQKEW